MPQRLDPIIEELHDVRREIAKRFEGDIHRISKDARQRQAQEGRPVWSFGQNWCRLSSLSVEEVIPDLFPPQESPKQQRFFGDVDRRIQRQGT